MSSVSASSSSAAASSSSSLPLTLVTGAAGHVGANLVRALLERGHERVRALVRKGSNNKGVEGLPVELFYGDLRDKKSIEAMVKGCTYVYHLAAFVSIRHGDREELFRSNIEGTKLLMEACLREGVRRVVYCSSFGAIRNVAPGVSDETSTFSPYELTTDYEVSKGFAEGEVWRLAAKGLDVVTVNPTGIVGPHDYKPSLLGKSILDFASGRSKAYVRGGFNMVPMRDVVAGTLLAMENGQRGERYLLSGEECSLDRCLDMIAKYTGGCRPRLAIPVPVMYHVAGVKDWVERTFFPNVYPRFTQGSIHLLSSGKRASNAKAVRELGLKPTPLEDAFKEACEWFISAGMLKDKRPRARM